MAGLLVLGQALAFLGFGQLGLRGVGWRRPDHVGAWLVVCAGAGYGIFGFWLAVVGHLHLLREVPVALALTVGVGLAVGSRDVRGAVRGLPAAVRAAWRADRVICGLALAALGVIVISAAAPPQAADELHYHWASPVWWAAHHEFLRSPFHYSNGVALAELEYTVDAVFALPTAAHLLDLEATLLLTAALASVLAYVGLPRIWAAALVLASPVVIFEAPIAYTDVIFAALAMSALVALLYAPEPRRWMITASVLAFAASVKFLALLAAPGFLWLDWRWSAQRSLPGVRARLRSVATNGLRLVAALIPVLLLWMLHTWLMVHTLFVTSGWYIKSVSVDPLAPGRVPNLVNLVEFPFLWVTTALFGDAQPYGNRVGVVALIFLPLCLVVCGRPWRRAPRAARRRVLALGIPAGLYLLADIVVARTRFNIYAWLLLAAAALVLPHDAWARRTRLSWAVRPLLIAAMLVGLGDGLRKLSFPHLG